MNLLRVLVVERGAEQVVQQQEGSPPHLGPLVTILKFSFAEKSKTANTEKITVRLSDSFTSVHGGGGAETERDAFTDTGTRVQPLPGEFKDSGQEPRLPRLFSAESQREHCRQRL